MAAIADATPGAAPRRVHLGAMVDEAHKRLLDENARKNDRSISAELRLALRLYEETETERSTKR